MLHKIFRKIFALLCIFNLLLACSTKNERKAKLLYNTQCASCHVLPAINDLPKRIWKETVLPDMGARMGIKDSAYNPYKGISFSEQEVIMQTGIYPAIPVISKGDWKLLKEYIISQAPDSMANNEQRIDYQEMAQFQPKSVNIDSVPGSFIMYLEFDNTTNAILTADLNGTLNSYEVVSQKNHVLYETDKAITSYSKLKGNSYFTYVGYLNPSENARGSLALVTSHDTIQIAADLHRPVHTLVHDLNDDGDDEIVLCEFGNLTGSLSLLVKDTTGSFEKTKLIEFPGSIRTIAKDMNGDAKDDLVILTSQGREGISILYQTEALKFTMEQPVQFSPVYGTSWFELVDYDNDGDQDIITVQGDNADKSYVAKPYHGMRIHINNGKNEFEEKYFFPLNGATRIVAKDFDQDGDIDFGVIATFPNYNDASPSFVFLENQDARDFVFKPFTFKDSNLGRWLLMDSGDFDGDGDEDIVLGSFTYSFTPVPKNLTQKWKNTNTDLMILENSLFK